METWLESVYSDGSEYFVSSPSPALGETVRVRLRLLDRAPVRHVLLRSLHNGLQEFQEMEKTAVLHGLRYYEAPLRMTENRVSYQFYLVTDDAVWYYTQRGVTSWMPDHTYNFTLLADYVQPEWVKDAVFYQIFPERFFNGDPANDVRDNEYALDGFGSIRMPSWDAAPLDYSRGRCMDFYGGDLNGIREKLPYLKNLGVTCLYLNPIFTAPSVHKYDCVDFFHVDPHLGGDKALAELTEAAHRMGIRVILDISINHTGAQHMWFNRDGVFFPRTSGAYNNPDSPERAYYFFDEKGRPHYWCGVESLPTLNYTSQALRDVIYRDKDAVLRKWLKSPYCIDGWRFDVADTFARNDRVQLAHTLWPEIRRAIREENPQAYILAEDWGDCAQYLQGDEWDSPMNYFGCARVIRSFLGQADRHLGRLPQLRGLRLKMTGQDVRERVLQHLAKLPFVIQQNQFNLLDSHDIDRFHNDPAVTPDMVRAAVIFQFMLTGAASIYYGDEVDIGGTLGSNEGCRWPMPWRENMESGAGFRLHRTMCALKAAHRALSRGGMKFLYASGPVFALSRFTPEEAFVAVFSNSDRAESVPIPFAAVGAAGPGEEIFGENPHALPGEDGCTFVTVPPCGALLLRCPML